MSKEYDKKFWKKDLPTSFSISESLEVVWEVIHEWEGDMQNHEVEERRQDIDNVKTAMSWIMDELGYDFDESGVTIPKQSTSTFIIKEKL